MRVKILAFVLGLIGALVLFNPNNAQATGQWCWWCDIPLPSISTSPTPSPEVSVEPSVEPSPTPSDSPAPQGGCCSATSGESVVNDGKPTYDPNRSDRGGKDPVAPLGAPNTGRAI